MTRGKLRNAATVVILALAATLVPLAGEAIAYTATDCRNRPVEVDTVRMDHGQLNFGDNPLERAPQPYYSFHNWRPTRDAVVCWGAKGTSVNIHGHLTWDGYGSGYMTFELRDTSNIRVSEIVRIDVDATNRDVLVNRTIWTVSTAGASKYADALVMRTYRSPDVQLGGGTQYFG